MDFTIVFKYCLDLLSSLIYPTKLKKKKKDLKWKTRNHVLFRITRSTYYPKVTVLKFTRDPISIVLYAKTGQRNTIYLFFCFLDSEFKLNFELDFQLNFFLT